MHISSPKRWSFETACDKVFQQIEQKIGENHTFLDHDAFYRKSMKISSILSFICGDFLTEIKPVPM